MSIKAGDICCIAKDVEGQYTHDHNFVQLMDRSDGCLVPYLYDDEVTTPFTSELVFFCEHCLEYAYRARPEDQRKPQDSES